MPKHNATEAIAPKTIDFTFIVVLIATQWLQLRPLMTHYDIHTKKRGASSVPGPHSEGSRIALLV